MIGWFASEINISIFIRFSNSWETLCTPSPSTKLNAVFEYFLHFTGDSRKKNTLSLIFPKVVFWISPKDKHPPNLLNSFVIGIWFAAVATTIEGRPKQHLSQWLEPPAPMDKSASAMRLAIWLVWTWQMKLCWSHNCWIFSFWGCCWPITTFTWTPKFKLMSMSNTRSVRLSASAPPKYTKIFLTSPDLTFTLSRMALNSGRKRAKLGPKMSRQCAGTLSR